MTTALPEWKLRILHSAQVEVQTTFLFLVSSIAVFVYDFALTFHEEVRYFWNGGHSLVKYLFLFNRYFTPILLASMTLLSSGFFPTGIKACRIITFADGIATVLLFACWNALIALRVRAIYGGRLGVRRAVVALLCATTLAELGLTINQMKQLDKHVWVITELSICVPGTEKMPKNYWSIWVPPIIYETTMFALTMRRLVTLERVAISDFTVSGLRSLLVRDGMMYYVTITCARIVNLVFFTGRDVCAPVLSTRNRSRSLTLYGSSSFLQPAKVYRALYIFLGFGSVLVSRMVLNLRMWSDWEAEEAKSPITFYPLRPPLARNRLRRNEASATSDDEIELNSYGGSQAVDPIDLELLSTVSDDSDSVIEIRGSVLSLSASY